MAKFLVNFHSQNNEPAVIKENGKDYDLDGDVERAEKIVGCLDHKLPYEERFEKYQRGSIYGAAFGWVGDTESPEDMKRLEQILDDYNG
tara:strand:+ start:1041 stop:1307 length:267 start_codon:yes stop_codon:yes gene_type:complete